MGRPTVLSLPPTRPRIGDEVHVEPGSSTFLTSMRQLRLRNQVDATRIRRPEKLPWRSLAARSTRTVRARPLGGRVPCSRAGFARPTESGGGAGRGAEPPSGDLPADGVSAAPGIGPGQEGAVRPHHDGTDRPRPPLPLRPILDAVPEISQRP